MNEIKDRKFTIVGLAIVTSYTLFILPHPNRFPVLTHSSVRLLLIVMMGILAYLDEQNKQNH